MILETTKLGTIDYTQADIVHFAKGLLGFETLKKYLLIKDTTESNFYFLQSIEEVDLCFILVYPNDFFQDYQIESDMPQAYTHHFAIVTQREQPAEPTVNLLGPIIINKTRQEGSQIISNNPHFHTRHLLPLQSPSKVSIATSSSVK